MGNVTTKKRQRSNGELEQWLRRPEVRKTMGAAFVHAEQKRLKRLWKRVHMIACSSAWADDNWHRREPYPPGGDESAMRCCPMCGRMTPPNYLTSSGACWDCHDASLPPSQMAALPPSSSAIHIQRWKMTQKRER